VPLLSDERLESIAQAITYESPTTYITHPLPGIRRVWFFGADAWVQWDLTIPAFVQLVDRLVELWDGQR
jgi:hypothetical protein